MVIDCTLSNLKIPGFPELVPEFGTKKADGQPVTARENDTNVRLPFIRQRPFPVTENSSTSVIEAHTSFVVYAAGITLTLGQGAFSGCRAEVFNVSAGYAGVTCGTATASVPPGGSVKFEYHGEWRIAESGGGFSPPYSARKTPFLAVSEKRVLRVFAGTKIEIEDATFTVAADLDFNAESSLDTGGAFVNGKDYYVFACKNTAGVGLTVKTSLTKTAPQGFAEEDVLLIGGFHTLCADVGTGLTYVEGGETKDHPLNGYIAGDILPYSVWCLNHRPFSEPEGMVYIQSLDFWCDIYLQSGSGANTKSAYQGAITRMRQYVDFVEDQFCVRKELLDDGEFAAAMLGSNEQTAVSGASETGAVSGGAGGRSDTASRRMISIYGVEEGCGSLWQWLRTTMAGGHGRSGLWANGYYYNIRNYYHDCIGIRSLWSIGGERIVLGSCRGCAGGGQVGWCCGLRFPVALCGLCAVGCECE